jgi:hypothetical protein
MSTQCDLTFVCDVLQLWKFITVGRGVWSMCNVMETGVDMVECFQ